MNNARPWIAHRPSELAEDCIADGIAAALKAKVPTAVIEATLRRYIAEIDWMRHPWEPPVLPPPFKLFRGPEVQLRLPLSVDRQTIQEPNP